MSHLLRIAYGAQAIRHLAVLNSSIRTRKALRQLPANLACAEDSRVYIFIPLFQEQSVIPGILEHFSPFLDSMTTLVLITTERETVVIGRSRETTTEEVATASADGKRVLHLHTPGLAARKGDQLNYATREVAAKTSESEHTKTLIIIYDADSRPDVSGLEEIRYQAQAYPQVPIFQQSALFHAPQKPDNTNGPWRRALLEAGALRANRFVLAYEWPRLRNRSPDQSWHQRVSSRYIFGNVAGHGLCLRLDWLLANPFPESTVMEDLQYSYDLAVANVPVVPLRALDQSEVPPSLSAQFRQAERWFLGPARVYQYRRSLRDDQSSSQATAVAVSAALISLEWLSCAVAPGLLMFGFRRRELRPWTIIFLLSYFLQLLVADQFQEPGCSRGDRVRRLLCYPIANCVFGAGGWSGLRKLVTSVPVADKTQRAP